jgi:DNA-binding PadR family transcriptional regulator
VILRFLILGLLRDGSRKHGYALAKEYRDRSGMEAHTGTFYRELQRLVTDGVVRGSTSCDTTTRCKSYEITQHGTAVFDEWLTGHDLDIADSPEDEISARALFLLDLDPAAAGRLLGHLRDALLFRAKRLERERRRALAHLGSGGQRSASAVLALLYARRLRHVAVDLGLVEALRSDCERRLAAGRLDAVARTTVAHDGTKLVHKRTQSTATVSIRRG